MKETGGRAREERVAAPGEEVTGRGEGVAVQGATAGEDKGPTREEGDTVREEDGKQTQVSRQCLLSLHGSVSN